MDQYDNTEEMDMNELHKRARAAVALEQNPDFAVFKQVITDQADLHRLGAQNQLEPSNTARRMQLLDMGKGLDDLLEFWDENVTNARELLEGPDAVAEREEETQEG